MSYVDANDRQLMALYYAYGRKDCNRLAPEPLAFGEHYRSQAEEFLNGTTSFLPSVQESWDLYRRSLK